MKQLLIMLAIATTLFACTKQMKDTAPGQNKTQSFQTGKGKGNHSTATQFHYFDIHDSIVFVAGVPRLAFVGNQIVSFPAGDIMWDLQCNYSLTDSNSAVPAQNAPFIFGYNQNPTPPINTNYFYYVLPNSFPGMGIVTGWFVGENFQVFSDPSTWHTTGSKFDQLTWNADTTITH